MSDINRYLSDNTQAKQLLFSCIRSLVSDGETRFFSLSDADKREIVGLLIKALHPTDLFNCVTEHKNSEAVMSALANYLISQNSEAKNEVTEILMRHAIEYYENVLDEYFQECAEEHESGKRDYWKTFNTCNETHYL